MNVGDYCYIKGISRDYGIGKITQLNSGYSSNGGELIDIQFKHSKHSVPKKDVISSDSPIDLIKVGDYVNGGQVRETEKDYIRISGGGYIWQFLKKEEIKSIVTHEQFSQMEYKVGE